MSGNSLFIDTNIALYLLAKDETLAELLDGRDVYISFITELELLGYKDIAQEDKKRLESFISDCIVIDINSEIKRNVIQLRSLHTIKLPDAIIASTALYLGLPLVTADKGFQKLEELALIIYEVNS